MGGLACEVLWAEGEVGDSVLYEECGYLVKIEIFLSSRWVCGMLLYDGYSAHCG